MFALKAYLSDGFEVNLDERYATEQAAIRAADHYIGDYSDPCRLGVYVTQVAIIFTDCGAGI
jgi:hypothetical protein